MKTNRCSSRQSVGLFVVFMALPILTVPADSINVRLVAESGFLGVIDHRIAFAQEDSTFRYHEDGGQDVLFPFLRFSAEVDVADRHTIIFLYQPLLLETRETLPEEFSVDGVEFAGDSLLSRYSFPFYRFSYLNEFFRSDRFSLAAGASLQIRNANIEFEAQGGEESAGYYRSAGVGPVPLLKARARYDLTGGFWLGAELDGIYAPISYFNGSDNDTVGALLDASLRAGYDGGGSIRPFINLRYLGGGASNDDPADYTENWINVFSLSLGAAADIW